MRSREEIESRLAEIEEEKEELEIEKEIYESYDVVEEIAKTVIDEINLGLHVTGITVNLWRIKDQNTTDNDWSLSANYCDIDRDIDIEVECEDLYRELLEEYSTQDLKEIKTYKYGVTDLRWSIAKIIKNLVNEVMDELIAIGFKK